MIIDEEIISNGITPHILIRLIEQHRSEHERYKKLYDYYIGEHEIRNRSPKSKGAANNRLVCNHAKYIVDMVQSYLTGNPITYSASEDFDIEPLKNAYLEQDIASLDSETVKSMSIYGRAYELIYANEQSRPRSVRLNPQNAFICYSQNADRRALFGVHYYGRYGLDGMLAGFVCNVYDDSYIYNFTSSGASLQGLELQSVEPHYFGGVPIIEYQNNDDIQGDFEQLISLIDAYNLLQSDRVNDKEQFVNSILFLTGCEIDTEQAKKLMHERILMGCEGAQAQYLSKNLNEADTKVLRDDIKDDIHRLSHVPDLSDESFGNNLSGVAIKYKLLGFEQHIKNKERYLTKALRLRFERYNHFLTVLNAMELVPTHRVDVVYTYNLPANELEISQMINNLKGFATDETLLSRLPFVTDAKEESELARKEQAQAYREKIEATQDLAQGGGY